MLRIILGIITGFVVSWFASFILLTISWMILKSEGSFQPDTFDISGKWIGAMMVVSVICGGLGGVLAGVIGRWKKMPIVFTILVALLGLPGVITAASTAGNDPTPREGEVTMFESMGQARQPVWAALLAMGVWAASAFAGAAKFSRPGDR